MKKIKTRLHVHISQKVERLFLYLGGVVLVLLVYVFAFRNLQLKNQELALSNDKLRTEETQLLQMKADEKSHKQAIAEMEGQIETMLNGFPEKNLEEDSIMLANKLEKNSEVRITDMYFAGKNMVQTGKQSGYTLYANPIEYNFSSGYNDLKNIVTSIYKAKVERNVETIHIGYDVDTGKLQVTMVLNEYSITGDGQEYHPVKIPDVSVGNQNPFATAQ